ncbi:NADH-quinone oxidoreductase subunit J [Opitutus sp. ER46]|uniref:NADH-quinone oxidoreductase subunit J family protein n=1 Tax=Opitutus sp. ER46 TaxID=2161864 RepID=UPI000D31F385|nr:NADH-quinone oxidoreductase subunit J [Opitutus sp. ER46]PTX90695.1 hypothetical protein DB354_18710 [Opitutus sp. ER46]
MSLIFLALALVILGPAAVAMALRNLIHSALLLVGCWAGIAAFYLWAGAEFVAFAQVLVYVGAVSMIVLFAVLLTRRAPGDATIGAESRRRFASALLTGGAVFGALAGAVVGTDVQMPVATPAPTIGVRELGRQLLGPHAAAVLIMGLLLTITLLGAVVLAAIDRDEPLPPGSPRPPSS